MQDRDAKYGERVIQDLVNECDHEASCENIGAIGDDGSAIAQTGGGGAGSQGPLGPQGPAGPKGDTGPAGPAGESCAQSGGIHDTSAR
jgi:hypothetical protein